MIKLTTNVHHDEYTEIANSMFDVPVNDVSTVEIPDDFILPENWNILLIYGASGSGKSTVLREKFGEPQKYDWDNSLSVISNFKYRGLTPKEASEVLCGVGLRSIPTWLRPYSCLSTGEKARADLAMALTSKDKYIVVDEYTSVVNRETAMSMSNSVQKYIRKHNLRVVLASCHSDIIEYLDSDYMYELPSGTLSQVRGLVRRSPIELTVRRVSYKIWDMFKNHHYLDNKLNKSARCFVAFWHDKPVAFYGILPQPSGHFKNGFRGSRLVVLPDYQGLGIGTKFRNYMASLVTAKEGARFYSRTVHPIIGEYGISHPELWQETSHSRKHQDKAKGFASYKLDTRESCAYAFKYVGESATEEEAKLFYGENSYENDVILSIGT